MSDDEEYGGGWPLVFTKGDLVFVMHRTWVPRIYRLEFGRSCMECGGLHREFHRYSTMGRIMRWLEARLPEEDDVG